MPSENVFQKSRWNKDFQTNKNWVYHKQTHIGENSKGQSWVKQKKKMKNGEQQIRVYILTIKQKWCLAFKIYRKGIKPGLVPHTYIPTYLGDWRRGSLEPRSSRPAWATKWDPASNSNNQYIYIYIYIYILYSIFYIEYRILYSILYSI
jgi:hypothetical protein